MFIISLLGTILVIIGIILTIPSLCNKTHISTTIGWAMAAVGMIIVSFCAFVAKNFVFATISLMFAMGNLYFCVTNSKD